MTRAAPAALQMPTANSPIGPHPVIEHEGPGDWRGERGVKGVPHGIVNPADLVRRRGIEVPHVRRRHRDVVGEAPIAVDPNDLRMGTDVGIAGPTEQAPAVDNVAFCRHAVPFAHVGHESADLHDVTREFVSHDDRRFDAPAGPIIPLVNVQVRTAHAGAADTDQYFVFSDRRFGNLGQYHTGFRCSLDQRSHAYRAPQWRSIRSTKQRAGGRRWGRCGGKIQHMRRLCCRRLWVVAPPGVTASQRSADAHSAKFAPHVVVRRQHCVLQCIFVVSIFAQHALCTVMPNSDSSCATKAVSQVNGWVVEAPPTASRWMLRLTSLSCRIGIA